MNEKWQKIYESNKKLDDIFENKYAGTENYYEKNCLGFLVELGEFVNESKVFKYWTIKPANKEKLLDEYADTITMALLFYRLLNLELEKPISHLDTTNVYEIINFLFLKGTELMYNLNEELVKEIFSNLLYLGNLLNLKEDEVIAAINKKHIIVKERLDSDY